VAQLKQQLNEKKGKQEPGFSLLVAYKDSVILTLHTGVEDIRSKKPIDENTSFYVASVAKTFTAAAILKLRQDKKLDLSDKISKYLPGLPAYTKDIRIFHLLTHMSGLPDYLDVLGEELPGFKNEDVLKFVQARDSLLFEPGLDYSYSNTGYILLAQIVEDISGKKFPDYINENLLLPSGMLTTKANDKPGKIVDNKAKGYTKDSLGNILISDYTNIYTVGSGGYYSTIFDLNKWLISLKKGTVISQRSFDLMTSFPIALTGKKSYLGMGWTNESWGPKTKGLENLKAFGSIGVFKGFRSMIFYLPDNNLHLILLSNNGSFGVELMDIIKTILFKKADQKD
jgi:CubicO group peptidase (beta-lactamase class C family)